MNIKVHRILAAIIIAMLSVIMLTACSSQGEEQNPSDVSETASVEEQEGYSAIEETNSRYKEGSQYVLRENLRVREQPSADAAWKKRSELIGYDMNRALSEENAVLEAGALVSCIETEGDWMRIDSGWICCKEGDEIYIDEPVCLTPPGDGDWSYEKGFYYDENGELFYITDSDEPLSGSYTISGSHPDYIAFNSDSSCVYHTQAGNMTPHFSEDGTCDGNYNYRNGKVYFRLGGTVTVDVFKIKGNTLVRQ